MQQKEDKKHLFFHTERNIYHNIQNKLKDMFFFEKSGNQNNHIKHPKKKVGLNKSRQIQHHNNKKDKPNQETQLINEKNVYQTNTNLEAA